MFDETVTQLDPIAEPQQRPHNVLIIDDDVDQTAVLSHRLESQGFQTLVASSGQSGLRLAQSELPDLILLDIRLPDLNGFDLCQQLADDSRTCGIPVLIVSGMEQSDVIRRARASGGRFYIRKPYDPNALLVLVQNALADDCL